MATNERQAKTGSDRIRRIGAATFKKSPHNLSSSASMPPDSSMIRMRERDDGVSPNSRLRTMSARRSLWITPKSGCGCLWPFGPVFSNNDGHCCSSFCARMRVAEQQQRSASAVPSLWSRVTG